MALTRPTCNLVQCLKTYLGICLFWAGMIFGRCAYILLRIVYNLSHFLIAFTWAVHAWPRGAVVNVELAVCAAVAVDAGALVLVHAVGAYAVVLARVA